MSKRPAWVPDDIPDEHIKEYAETVGGTLARLAWQEKRLTGATPRTDQTHAHIKHLRDKHLKKGGDSHADQ